MMFTASAFACRRAIRRAGLLALGLLLVLPSFSRAADAPASPAPASLPAATSTSSPSASSSAGLTDTYKIQAQDILVIEVVNEPQIGSKEFRVSAGGEISYPYINILKVGERTPIEVQKELKRLLEADYLVNAQVIVQVKEYRKRLVSVMGQVNRPGPVEIPPERRLTVIEAISQAGSFTRLARKNDIEISRTGLQKPIRCSDEEQRNNPDKVIYLEPGDVVYIPESRI